MRKSVIFGILVLLCLPLMAKVNYDLFYACENGEIEKVKQILKQPNVSVNEFDTLFDLPLIVALKNGNESIVKALIEAKANINLPGKEEETPLQVAILNNRENMVVLLLQEGAKVSSKDLVSAISMQKPTFVNYLLKSGINLKDPVNNTVWEQAIRTKNPKILEMLLKAGANPNTRLSGGTMTGLIVLVRARKVELVKMLLQAGADVNLAGRGSTPLIEAIRNRQLPMVKLLLEAKANPNMADSDGTPLMYAAKANQPEIVKLLLTAGANVNQLLPNGKTVLQLFQGQKNKKEIIELLEQAASGK